MPLNQSLPALSFFLNGTQDNIMFEDSNLNGAALNFSGGLSIYGDTAFILLNNHNISSFNVNLQFSVIRLSGIYSPSKNVTLNTGLYNDMVPLDYPLVAISANQPLGSICLSAPHLIQPEQNQCLPI